MQTFCDCDLILNTVVKWHVEDDDVFKTRESGDTDDVYMAAIVEYDDDDVYTVAGGYLWFSRDRRRRFRYHGRQ